MGTGPSNTNDNIPCCRIAVIGRGRLGTALARAFTDRGHRVDGPIGRDTVPSPNSEIVLLCVPDAEIAAAASAVPTGPLLGHCSGAGGLDLLGSREGFSLHPLMTLTADPELGARRLQGAAAAIDATSANALACARGLATSIGMRPVKVATEDRAAYHAAATLASNFLLTLGDAAERLAASAGVVRLDLVPLAQAALDNWAATGAAAALTGPIARGDEATVALQREAVATRTPELVDLFDELCSQTRVLAHPLTGVSV